jgi:ABC-type antimicrobial peptide transport system permease subunit
VLWQRFLIESVVTTFLGGTASITLAVVISGAIAFFAHWKMIISLGALLVAFIFSAAVGLIFGLAPLARRQSSIQLVHCVMNKPQ